MREEFANEESFKRPPDLRHPNFPPQFYNMYQPQLLLPNNSAFHRPDGGKSIPVSSRLKISLNFILFTSHSDAWLCSTSL